MNRTSNVLFVNSSSDTRKKWGEKFYTSFSHITTNLFVCVKNIEPPQWPNQARALSPIVKGRWFEPQTDKSK